MTREIKFRGKSIEDGEWVYGNYSNDPCPNITFYNDESELDVREIDPNTLGQYIGEKSKSGQDIYEGDLIVLRTPYRTTQTHEGDNIPNGSYTEPMEPAVKTEILEISYSDGCFGVRKENDVFEIFPFGWIIREWSLDDVEESIYYRNYEKDMFADPDEGDLAYLLEEYGIENPDDFLTWISGVEIQGNIHDNTELI